MYVWSKTSGGDWLAFFELLAFFDRFALDVPDQLVGAMRTLADAHHYFVQLGTVSEDGRSTRGRGPTLQTPTQRTSTICSSSTRPANTWFATGCVA